MNSERYPSWFVQEEQVHGEQRGAGNPGESMDWARAGRWERVFFSQSLCFLSTVGGGVVVCGGRLFIPPGHGARGLWGRPRTGRSRRSRTFKPTVGPVQVVLYRRRSPMARESSSLPPDCVHPLLGLLWDPITPLCITRLLALWFLDGSSRREGRKEGPCSFSPGSPWAGLIPFQLSTWQRGTQPGFEYLPPPSALGPKAANPSLLLPVPGHHLIPCWVP